MDVTSITSSTVINLAVFRMTYYHTTLAVSAIYCAQYVV